MFRGDRTTRATQITDVEVRTMESWLDADQAGQDADAERILRHGLDAEHYLALLPVSDDQVTEAEGAVFNELLELLEGAAGKKVEFRVRPQFSVDVAGGA